MASCRFTVFALVVLSTYSLAQSGASRKLKSSPFESALDMLQNQIGYTFKNIGYLRRAMTHSSFSQENNKALSILGSNVIDTSVSMYYLGKDIEISSKDLNRWISENAKVDTSCAVDGMRLGLHRVVRVSPKTNSTAPAVVCSAFRAIFGAIAIDTRKVDDAGSVFWNVHCSEVGRVMDT
ncbi:protein NUCLEAR FUSION DEFECTIVE 2-like [Populus nigra]|uniref:protein NUCLEAR FUSION DEFECTIVE 2-like n=1 Tax=Populus nigra TaxID=3691 RepID=UPI002B26FC04|nr:protein NUCLEAR FUSION DEFECTIVE 2-like [Populus nigra]